MRWTRTLVAVALTGAAALGGWTLVRPARAQAPSTLYVSGLRIAGDRPVAQVRITNASDRPGDFYTVFYSVFYPDGRAATPPGAEMGQILFPGRTITIDVGAAVSAAREQAEVGSYTGPVQFVAYGTTCADAGVCPPNAGTPRPFGPELISVEAVQVEGTAVYDAVFQWKARE